MNDVSRYLFLAGALPYVLLGIAHALHTPRATGDRKGLTPADPGLAESMARSRVLLTGRTDVWRAWVGFNFTHSLGAVLFGAALLLVGRTADSFAHDAAVFLPFAVIVSLIYLAIGLAYFFRTPIAGIALSVVLFVAAWLLRLAS
jgi:hypothetical protein